MYILSLIIIYLLLIFQMAGLRVISNSNKFLAFILFQAVPVGFLILTINKIAEELAINSIAGEILIFVMLGLLPIAIMRLRPNIILGLKKYL